ncbi:uncharacterized protein LOC144352781 [Saccoglossus kowalevskii]
MCDVMINDNMHTLTEIVMTCQPVLQARYVSTYLQDDNILNLAEVMVFGIAMCEDPGVPAHGHLLSPAISNPVYAGHELQYECNNGFEMSGSGIINCTTEAAWSDVIPSCQAIGSMTTKNPVEESTQQQQHQQGHTTQHHVPVTYMSPTTAISNQLPLLSLLILLPILLLIVLCVAKRKAVNKIVVEVASKKRAENADEKKKIGSEDVLLTPKWI